MPSTRLGLALAISRHQRSAWRFRSSKSVNSRPARKFVSTQEKGRSIRPLRSEWPMAWARNPKPRAPAKAAISGAMTASGPLPRARMTLVLSMMHSGHTPSMKRAACEQEVLGLEAREPRVVLDEDPPRVGQDQARALGLDGLAADPDPVRRGVVLHLLARLEVVFARPFGRRAQSGLAHPAGERAVRQHQAVLVGEDLLNAHGIAADAFEGGLEPVAGRRIEGHRCLRCGIGVAQDAAHGITRQLEQAADLAQGASLRLQRPHGIADLDRSHRGRAS